MSRIILYNQECSDVIDAQVQKFHNVILKIRSISDFHGNVTTAFGDEVWKRHESVVSVVTHVNLES